MNIKEFAEIYYLISSGSSEIAVRKDMSKFRKQILNSFDNSDGFKKVAFDTRRINQETDFIPRRGLQNYHRSEAFLSEATSNKIQNFAKIKRGLENLKEKYGKEPE